MQNRPILDGDHSRMFSHFLYNESGTSLSSFSCFYIINPVECTFLFGGFAGQNSHLLLAIIVKHLDHRNVLKHPGMQLDIVELTTFLARQAKVETSVSIIGAVSDIMRHLRKSIHCSLDDANLGADVIKWNRRFGEVVDECLVQLSLKVLSHFFTYYYYHCS